MTNVYSTQLYKRIKNMSEEDLLKKEVGETRLKIKLAYFKLSQATDIMLVESIVLELISLETKHDYLLKRLKGGKEK